MPLIHLWIPPINPDTPSPQNTMVYNSYKKIYILPYNHNTSMKIRKLTLIQYYYLTHRTCLSFAKSWIKFKFHICFIPDI